MAIHEALLLQIKQELGLWLVMFGIDPDASRIYTTVHHRQIVILVLDGGQFSSYRFSCSKAKLRWRHWHERELALRVLVHKLGRGIYAPA